MKWINMMMPDGVRVVPESQTDNFAELEIAPLERGFGHTLGNALRHTLLSSIHGHGITAVQIEGVKHVYSVSQPGLAVLTVEFQVGVPVKAVRSISTPFRPRSSMSSSMPCEPVWFNVPKLTGWDRLTGAGVASKAPG